ncbi:MAG: ureidoglycolate lyase [Rhodospirillales bacterium]|nr:ureidoglycolate lyase [Rhodospirillales bacterium]
MRAFISDGAQGINYHRRVWHHPLVALAEEADFLVIDRGAEGEDCIEHHFAEAEWKTVTV